MTLTFVATLRADATTTPSSCATSNASMLSQFSRSAMLLGDVGIARLQAAKVALFGVGGVGAAAAEALVRAGLGALDLIDGDRVSITNLNRQLCATHPTLNQLKVAAMRTRLLQINPHATITTHPRFITPADLPTFDLSGYSYVIDAIDTTATKIALAVACHQAAIPLIASMGAGNKLDPTRFEVADLFDTAVCPLAKVIRRELRARNIPHLRVVYSRELPVTTTPPPTSSSESPTTGHRAPGSVSFVPPVVGLILAGEVIKTIALKLTHA